MQLKDENLFDSTGIFLYPGDFHMMKCAMTVTWNIFEGPGIDDLVGKLYKDAIYTSSCISNC
jgi:hypothetical protein